MATLDEVADAVVDAVVATLQAPPYGATVDTGGALGRQFIKNPPMQVGKGFPFGQALSEILGQFQAQVTVYPQAKLSQNRTDRKPSFKLVAPITVPLSATITPSGNNSIVTFTGSVVPGLNVFAFFGRPKVPAMYQTQGADDLNAVAAQIAAQINANGGSASSNANAVTVNNSAVTVNIGGSGTMVAEIRRTMTPVQVTVWASDPNMREAISKQLENGMAPSWPIPFLQAVDGSAIWIRQRGSPMPDDLSQSSYSLYVANIIYECEYPTWATIEGTEIEGIDVTTTTQPGAVSSSAWTD